MIIKFNMSHVKKIKLNGYCLKSSLKLENNGELYFVPCYLGVKMSNTYLIRNLSWMGVNVSIKIP